MACRVGPLLRRRAGPAPTTANLDESAPWRRLPQVDLRCSGRGREHLTLVFKVLRLRPMRVKLLDRIDLSRWRRTAFDTTAQWIIPCSIYRSSNWARGRLFPTAAPIRDARLTSSGNSMASATLIKSTSGPWAQAFVRCLGGSRHTKGDPERSPVDNSRPAAWLRLLPIPPTPRSNEAGAEQEQRGGFGDGWTARHQHSRPHTATPNSDATVSLDRYHG